MDVGSIIKEKKWLLDVGCWRLLDYSGDWTAMSTSRMKLALACLFNSSRYLPAEELV